MNELYLNNVPYIGKAAYINGYNGYESTKDDGLLCAIINNSCWTNHVPNALKDKYGNTIVDKYRRGVEINIK